MGVCLVGRRHAMPHRLSFRLARHGRTHRIARLLVPGDLRRRHPAWLLPAATHAAAIATAAAAAVASTTLGLASSSGHRPVPPPTSAASLALASTALALASTALATARRRCHNVAFTAAALTAVSGPEECRAHDDGRGQRERL